MKIIYQKNVGHILLFLTISMLLSGCATMERVKVTGIDTSARSLKELCAKHNIEWTRDSISQMVTLKGQRAVAKFLISSSIVYIDNQRIVLESPVITRESRILVPGDFKRKVIDLIKEEKYKARKAVYRLTKVKSIIIDAGHGGKDSGAIGLRGLQEKKVVWDITKRLKSILEKEGFKIIVTRDSDEFISLKERTAIASRSNADLFVSIHANSSRVRGVNGVEVFALEPNSYSKKKGDVLIKNKRLLLSKKRMSKKDRVIDDIVSDLVLTYKRKESEVLAKKIVKQMSKFIKAKNRGQKYSRFYVLRNTLIPAVLVEVGFITNPKEGRLLRTKSYRLKVAHGLARGILSYVNSP